MPREVQMISLLGAWRIFHNLSKNTFSCQVITKRDPCKSDIQTPQQILTMWSIRKASFKSVLEMLLGFSNVICVGIWAHNWIWSKTFPSSIFCDGSISSGWACHNRGFFNYSLSKAQAPKFNLGGETPWLLDCRSDLSELCPCYFCLKPFMKQLLYIYLATMSIL